VLTVERANEMKQIDLMGKNEAWDRIQEMDTAGAFENYYWVDLANTGFRWWRWVANIARDRIGRGARDASAKKIEQD